MDIRDILVINPGSTSTKIAVYTDHNSRTVINYAIVHDDEIINSFGSLGEQENYRKKMILGQLKDADYDMSNLSAVVGRGGMAPELESGGYRVNEALCCRMTSSQIPQHASSLGAVLAYSIGKPLGIPAYIYDSTMGSELDALAGGAYRLLTGQEKTKEYTYGQ
ncbi:MAG: hypothetical protein GX663_07430 [Clostridiales bacterium]|nr:hypothetical protein [Clostridiales bacterium]